MKTKLNRSLMKQRPLFLGIGLIMAMSLTLASFEWRVFYENENIINEPIAVLEEEPIYDVSKLIEKKETPPKVNKPTVSASDPTEILDPTKTTTEETTEDHSGEKNKMKSPNTNGIHDLEEELSEEVDPPFPIVEDMPRFKEDEKVTGYDEQVVAFNKRLNVFLKKNLTFPARCRDLGYSGKVYISFIVEKDGSVSTVEVLRGICEDADKEAVRVIQKLPELVPGKQRGRPVRVIFKIPIYFQLQ